MAKIFIGINTLTDVDQMAYSNHMQFFFRCGRSTTHEYALCAPRRMSIDRMRNMSARIVAEDPTFDYLMFIDDDVLVPFDAIEQLISCNADIAAGWTLIRGYPFKNMFFRLKDESTANITNYEEPFEFDEKGNIPCVAVGFSCVLIRADLIRKVSSPWFVTGGYNTEDVYFCLKAINEVESTTIVVNPNVKTAHILEPEAIAPENKAAFVKYMQDTRPWTAIEGEDNPKDAQYPMNDTSGTVDYRDYLAAELQLPEEPIAK